MGTLLPTARLTWCGSHAFVSLSLYPSSYSYSSRGGRFTFFGHKSIFSLFDFFPKSKNRQRFFVMIFFIDKNQGTIFCHDFFHREKSYHDFFGRFFGKYEKSYHDFFLTIFFTVFLNIIIFCCIFSYFCPRNG